MLQAEQINSQDIGSLSLTGVTQLGLFSRDFH
jgi:hypothetical protein